MRNRFMVYIIFMAVMVVVPFVSTGFVLAEATDVDVSILRKPTLVDEESEQCFQFNATQGPPPCDQTRVFSTWVIDTKTNPANKCKVEVYVLYHGVQQPECIEVKKPLNKIPGQSLDKIASFTVNDVPTAKKLRNIFPKNGGTDCNEVWLRFADDKGCNGRCFTSGGRAYCY